MERSRTHRLAHNRRKPIRMMTFVTHFVALLIAMASFPTVGLAQSNLPPQTDSRGIPPTRPNTLPIETQGRTQAPVGHRQPRAQDLPPSVLRKESGAGRGSNAEMELDQKLGICKGC
jgi:hypothetical protein